MKNKSLTMLVLATLATTTMAVAFVPTASAHYCNDTRYNLSCGGCPASLTSPFHAHSTDGNIYCMSVGTVGVGPAGKASSGSAVPSFFGNLVSAMF